MKINIFNSLLFGILLMAETQMNLVAWSQETTKEVPSDDCQLELEKNSFESLYQLQKKFFLDFIESDDQTIEEWSEFQKNFTQIILERTKLIEPYFYNDQKRTKWLNLLLRQAIQILPSHQFDPFAQSLDEHLQQKFIPALSLNFSQDQLITLTKMNHGETTKAPLGREGAATWTDRFGNFYLWSGQRIFSQMMDDFWRFNQNEQAWEEVVVEQGKADSTPSKRSNPQTWTDQAGLFYLMGGFGKNEEGTFGYFNDLWRFNPYNNQWAFLKGKKNKINHRGKYLVINQYHKKIYPSGRYDAATWTDRQGDLYLMGGYGPSPLSQGSSYLNDLWKFDITLNQWKLILHDGREVPSIRSGAGTWSDLQQNKFYLMGGETVPTASNEFLLDDLWSFDPQSEVWTKEHEISENNLPLSTAPLRRKKPITWIGRDYQLYLFAGKTKSHKRSLRNYNYEELEDFWKYHPQEKKWTLIKEEFPSFRYMDEERQVSLKINSPLYWVDQRGKVRLFGGLVYINKYDALSNDHFWILDQEDIKDNL